MARRFFYVSLALLCLTAAYQLGAGGARADWDQTLAGSVVGVDGSRVWDSSGRGWTVSDTPPEWIRTESLDLPVPATQVKLLSGNVLVTYDDVAWRYSQQQGWIDIGPFPGGPVAVEQQSFGGTKGAYR